MAKCYHPGCKAKPYKRVRQTGGASQKWQPTCLDHAPKLESDFAATGWEERHYA